MDRSPSVHANEICVRHIVVMYFSFKKPNYYNRLYYTFCAHAVVTKSTMLILRKKGIWIPLKTVDILSMLCIF